jgi:hypothetical protein
LFILAADEAGGRSSTRSRKRRARRLYVATRPAAQLDVGRLIAPLE